MQLIAKNLHKKFKDFKAVDSFSFELNAGEVLGLLGPNGAGKTTIIGMLYGAVIPDAGEITLGEFNLLSGQASKAKQFMGVVTQENNLDPDLTVYQNLIVFSRFYGITGKKAEERVNYLLKLTNLIHKKDSNVEELSGGMKRKLILARSLVASPKFIFLDEPTTGLDPDARQDLWKLVNHLRNEGVSILLTTHYMDEAERLCDRIILLQNGKTIDAGSPSEMILKKIGKTVIEIYGVSQDQVQGVAEKYNLWWREFADGFLIALPDQINTLLEELKLLNATNIKERDANLEDVFLKLTGEKLN
ncbi:MAG: ABC transporter ATP-binding protein [Candidatus Melainabacteria bacterium]|jgi:lipooligosaccharide transport system ATP-binding protein